MTTSIPFAEIRSWIFESALPLWMKIGIDERSGHFVEKTDFDGKPMLDGARRMRVAGRQTYVFSHALTLGYGAAADASLFGANALDRLYLGPERGWPRTYDATGAPLDCTPDLYDLAFVLFGYAWRHRATGDAASQLGAHRALDFIDARLRAPVGYWHASPVVGSRLQNPHMHLLEACLAAHEATGAPRFVNTARDIVALFRSAFFDGQTLAEYFDSDWKREPGERGRCIEPGHHYEWTWILTQYARATGEDTLREATLLTDFAERHGFNAVSGRVSMSVRDDGEAIDASSRTWPNTERIKAHLALFEAGGADPREPVAHSTRVLLDQYLATDRRGLWVDHFDANGRAIADSVPASTLYHIFLAFAEVLRLEPKLGGLGSTPAAR